jgi:sugar-phosphatase
MIEAFIFDLDGTIIDSEPLWQEAELEIFAEEGVELTPEDIAPSKGLYTLDAVKLLYPKINSPRRSIEELTRALNERALHLILDRGNLKHGVVETIALLASTKVPMAIASSTIRHMIGKIAGHFEIEKYFTLYCSGQEERYGKPHPAIYLTCTRKLGADPQKSIAFEDSFNGMLSARAAGLKLVAYLDIGNYADTKYDFADLKLESFHNFGPSELTYLESLV